MTSSPIKIVAIIVIASIGLLVWPVEQARSDSIVTDGDIVVDGASFLELQSLVCQLASLDISPLPPVCILGAGERFIFATSTTSTAGGNLVQWAINILGTPTFTDGLVAGDAICQKHADDAGLPGTYKAWLSTGTVDAKNRIGDHTWIRREGQVVASSKAQLISCVYEGPPCLFNTLQDENAAIVGHTHFTGTYEDGTRDLAGTYSPSHCQNWTDQASLEDGWSGLPDYTDFRWTAVSRAQCNESLGLLCMQN